MIFETLNITVCVVLQITVTLKWKTTFSSIYGYDSNLATVTFAVSQGPVLGPYQAKKFCKFNHFDDDTSF